jgi:hypothetical protein
MNTPPRLYNVREELIFLLNQAAELEHGLACSYLFASFSLKSSVVEGLPEEAVPVVRNWKKVLRGVAIDEMAHLGVVCNLLTAVGGAPNLDRPNFPQTTSYYLPDYSIELQPFNEQVLEHFVYIERPEAMVAEPVMDADANEPVHAPTRNEVGPNPFDEESVAALYEEIKTALKALVERVGTDSAFIGRREAEDADNRLAVGDYPAIVDLATAYAAIDSVVEEGEGDTANRADSHYGKFRRIQEEFHNLKAKDPDFAPAFPVLENPFPRTPPLNLAPVNLLTNGDAGDVADLFDACYATMLEILARFFAGAGQQWSEADALVDCSITMMSSVLAPLGEVLCRMPAHEAGKETAGPSFGLYRAIEPLAQRRAAMVLLVERLEDLSRYAADLSTRTAAVAPIAKTLERLAGNLKQASQAAT